MSMLCCIGATAVLLLLLTAAATPLSQLPLLLLLLQKHGAAGADISTPAASTTLANIKIAYGAALGRELLEFEASHQSEVNTVTYILRST
jgi:hypothetical protein